jgi:hypothetical protein
MHVGAASKKANVRWAAGMWGDRGKPPMQDNAVKDLSEMMASSGKSKNMADEAFFRNDQTLSVRVGDTYVSVKPPIGRSRTSGATPPLDENEKKRIALAIAVKVIQKLP